MRIGNRQFAESDVAFDAGKFRVFFSRINFKIQNPAVVRRCRDMTHIARRNRNFFGQNLERVYLSRVMASRAFEVGVARKFVPKRRGRISFAPRKQSDFVQITDCRGKFCVKIGFRLLRSEFMTRRAICWRGQNSRVRRMTAKTSRVAYRRCFESSFFQPESITQFGGRFRNKFDIRFALRLISLMTHRTAFFAVFGMFIVRKRDCEIGNVPYSFGGFVKNLARIRKRMACAVARTRIRMTNRTNRRFRASEKLLAMTT